MNGKAKVLNFINEVRKQEERNAQENAFKSSTLYKRNTINKEKTIAMEECYSRILTGFYKNCLPFSEEYKSVYSDDLTSDFHTFMESYYQDKSFSAIVTEGSKKGNPIMKRLEKNVTKFVNESFADKEAHIDTIDSFDLKMVFTEEDNENLNEISDKMEFNDISKLVKKNVKNSIKGELSATKKQKEDTKAFEDSLVENNNVKTESELNRAILKSGRTDFLGSSKIYHPSLFESILIANQNNVMKENVVDNALDELRVTIESASDNESGVISEDGTRLKNENESVMIESVKTFTGLNVLKTLRLESFSPSKTKMLAYKYAKM